MHSNLITLLLVPNHANLSPGVLMLEPDYYTKAKYLDHLLNKGDNDTATNLLQEEFLKSDPKDWEMFTNQAIANTSAGWAPDLYWDGDELKVNDNFIGDSTLINTKDVASQEVIDSAHPDEEVERISRALNTLLKTDNKEDAFRNLTNFLDAASGMPADRQAELIKRAIEINKIETKLDPNLPSFDLIDLGDLDKDGKTDIVLNLKENRDDTSRGSYVPMW